MNTNQDDVMQIRFIRKQWLII